MARANRKSGSRRRRQAVDWVVNPISYSDDGETSLPTASIVAYPLTFSQNARLLSVGSAGPISVGGFAVVEGANQRTLAVRGDVVGLAANWTIGNRLYFMMRLMVLPMDPTTTDVVFPANYNLFEAESANEEFAWQKLVSRTFSDAGSRADFHVMVNATVKRRITEDEALFMVIQNNGTGLSNIALFLRTLCVAPM